VGLGASTAYLIPWSLLPDAIDADPDRPAGPLHRLDGALPEDRHRPQHPAAGHSAVGEWLPIRQVCGGAVEMVAQPASALLTVRFCMGLIPALLVVLGLVVMRRWPEKGAHLQPVAP
jgi:GPH family glycoside/pentoside/hexuronide:cation symporter